MTRNHPLPFPVRDAADLKRAVSYTMRTRDIDRPAAQRYVMARARALGHMDLVPTAWGGRQAPTVAVSHGSLDQVFADKAEQHGIGVAKLKTVYFRGVEEYHAANFDIGTPTMWGLARVQRFINCMATGQPLTSDEDLVAVAETAVPDAGIDICVDASAIVADVVYSDGSKTASMFYPADVRSISLEDETITVDGSLDGQAWRYELDTATGEHELRIGDTVSS